MRTEFADADYWSELATKRKVRLPWWTTPCTVVGMKQILKKYGVSQTWYNTNTNWMPLEIFIERNPEWPLRAWAGLLLESIEERKKDKNG